MTGPDRASIVRISDHLVRLVQILFALVIGQSLLLYREVIVNVFAFQYWVAAAALLVVYLTTILSWIGYHRSMERNPYAMHLHESRTARCWDGTRLFFDLFTVVLYAYLLFSIGPVVQDPAADLHKHLVGYPLIFMAYWASGKARVRIYGPRASRSALLAGCILVYWILWVAYNAVRDWNVGLPAWFFNLVALGIFGLAMIVYRIINVRVRARAERLYSGR